MFLYIAKAGVITQTRKLSWIIRGQVSQRGLYKREGGAMSGKMRCEDGDVGRTRL
jgi:hypothetical protein